RLLAVVALVSVAAVAAVGALLATAMTVVPAATTRLLVNRMLPWQLASMALGAVQSLAGLWLSVELNAPPGAAIAVLGGVLFALAGAWVAWRDRPRRHGAVVAA
ncbi:MAG: metal ABC transporter permease, partial [Solirubrobacteraceae bacterium]